MQKYIFCKIENVKLQSSFCNWNIYRYPFWNQTSDEIFVGICLKLSLSQGSKTRLSQIKNVCLPASFMFILLPLFNNKWSIRIFIINFSLCKLFNDIWKKIKSIYFCICFRLKMSFQLASLTRVIGYLFNSPSI